MKSKIIVEYKGDYIHVRQSGEDSYEISLDMWRRIVAECEQYNCFNILGESCITQELSTLDAYHHVKIFQLAGVTHRHRIAWVHHGSDEKDIARFIENVLINRGMVNGRFFPNVEEAKKWLLGEGNE
jgi:hypothetical protein